MKNINPVIWTKAATKLYYWCVELCYVAATYMLLQTAIGGIHLKYFSQFVCFHPKHTNQIQIAMIIFVDAYNRTLHVIQSLHGVRFIDNIDLAL